MLSSEIKTFFKHFIKEFKKREKINFDRLKPFYNNIKKEYSNVLKKGSSKHTHFSILRTDSSGIHPRRNFIKQISNTPSFNSAFPLFSESDKVFVRGILENTLDNSAMNSWFNQNGETPLTKFLGNSTTDHLFGYYTPSEIHHEIACEFDTREKHHLIYNSISVEFEVNYCLKRKLDQLKRLQFQIRTILLGALAPNANRYDIKLYLSNFAKEMEEGDSNVLGARNINSGVTTIYRYSRGNVNHTTVYRNEEMGKLILHELIHNLEYDLAFNDSHDSELHNYFNVSRDCPILLNESYTETVACIMNCILVSIENGKNFNDIKENLYLELVFNLFQTAKILNHYGFSSVEEINTADDGSGRFRQATNVLSYFYLKTAILMDFDALMDFFEKHTTNFYISDKEKAIKDFFELVVAATRKPQFGFYINGFIKVIKNGGNLSESIMKTLRMTIVE